MVFSGLSDAVEASTFGCLTLYRDTKFIIGFDFAGTISSPASSGVLFDIKIIDGTEMADFEQTQQMIPFITCEISLCQLGVNVFDLDFGFQMDSVEQPIKSNSVGSGHVSHCRTSSSNDHFDHGFVVFKNVQLRLIVRRMCVGGHIIHITQLINLLSSFDFLGLSFGMKSRTSFLNACMFGLDIVVG